VHKYYKLPRLGKSAEELGENEISRLKTIESLIPGDVKTILDVGCGDGIICNPLGKRFNTVGIDFVQEALLHITTKKVQACAEFLPFKGSSFDLVLLSDILEHLSKDVLSEVINQAQRVSRKYVLVNVPNKEDLSLNTVICPRCSNKFHINWHKMSFDEDKVLRMFNKLKPVESKYCGLLHLRFQGIFIRIKRFIFKRASLANALTVCPFCTYTSEEVKIKNDSPLSLAFTKTLRGKAIMFFKNILGGEFSEIAILFRK